MSDERHFLHDLIGPLSAANNLLEILMEELKQTNSQKLDLSKLDRILKAVESACDLVGQRRETLSQAQEVK